MGGKLILTTLRLAQDLIGRADALIAALESAPEFVAAGEVTRAHVLRLAIVRGLEVLEQEHSKGKRRR